MTNPRRNMKLEAADAEVTRCVYCGNWHVRDSGICAHCKKHGYPTIDDLERTA